MSWQDVYLPEAIEDIRKLDGSQRKLVKKAIDKLKINLLPAEEGGYGRHLGNKGGVNLTGCLMAKIKGAGLRIVYELVRDENNFIVIVVGVREDAEVYEEAEARIKGNTQKSC